MFHLAKCLQNIMLNHELGQQVRQLIFLHALFSPDHQSFDRNLFVCEVRGENDADPAGHYSQEDNQNMQRPLKICLLIYLAFCVYLPQWTVKSLRVVFHMLQFSPVSPEFAK